MERVDSAELTDAIDAANPLAEPHRIPWQFEVRDDAAGAVEVESLAGGVGGDEQWLRAAAEAIERSGSLCTRQPAMQDRGISGEGRLQVKRRVAVLREDDERLA